MRTINTIGRRTVIIEDENRLEIHIKVSRDYLMPMFCALWLGCWTMVGAVMLWSLLNGQWVAPILAYIPLQCGWILGELVSLIFFLWHLYGQEIIIVTPKKFVYKRDILGRAKIERLDTPELQNLRAELAPLSYSQHDPVNGALGVGTIIADVLGQPYRFGIRLGEDEADALIEALKPYLSSSSNSLATPESGVSDSSRSS